MHRKFCPKCGTPMFSEAEVRTNVLVIRSGTLDNLEDGAPEVTIWTKIAPSWACIRETIAKVEGQPADRKILMDALTAIYGAAP